ncbi:MAG: hypothetical protein EPO30_08490 [Lysobacteraceae bacterium]|nr:MAG: hypothetical protein EPO30_08490 [Xanthomonadaceae bacterium]
MRATIILLLATAALPATAWANTCPAPAAQPLQPTAVVPVANELAPLAIGQLGAPDGVLAQAYDKALTLDQVLLRLRVDACLALAATTPAGSPGALTDPATYQKRTEFDNTPWRFNMSQNGKNMTADEFSAWMKSRGVRVARGAAPAPADPAAPPPPAAPAGELPVVPPPAPELPSPTEPVTAD